MATTRPTSFKALRMQVRDAGSFGQIQGQGFHLPPAGRQLLQVWIRVGCQEVNPCELRRQPPVRPVALSGRCSRCSLPISPMRRDPVGTRTRPLARATRGSHPKASRASAGSAALRGDGVPYRALPRAPDSQGLDVLATMVHRHSKYQDKFYAQEPSLLGEVWAMAGGSGSDLAIVDMGAGNGCLAIIASLTLDAQVVIVDHTLTREELRVESRIQEKYHHRSLSHARHRGHGHGARSTTLRHTKGCCGCEAPL